LFICSNCKNCWQSAVWAPPAQATAPFWRSFSLHAVVVNVGGGRSEDEHDEKFVGQVIWAELQTRGVTAVSHVELETVQSAHVAPPCPHAVSMKPASQRPFASQHPFGQVAAEHGGGGGSHDCPRPQTSPNCEQLTQALPPEPHAAFVDPLSQFPNVSQHPLGQVCGPQVPLSTKVHCCPAQVAPNEPQFSQALPKSPHEKVSCPPSQKPFTSQQPFGHVCALHAPPSGVTSEHSCPLHDSPKDAQSWHAMPKSPHAKVLCPLSQTPLASQQPFGHVCALHDGGGVTMHSWNSHVAPSCRQFWHATAFAPHAVDEMPDWQLPSGSQHPPGQLMSLQVETTPSQNPPPSGVGAHCSFVARQFWHCSPPKPHALCVRPVTHWLPKQHPAQLPGPHASDVHACP